MSEESFEQLLNQYEAQEPRPGDRTECEVIKITDNEVIVDAGLKSEARIPIEQFRNSSGELEVKIGDKVPVVLENIDNGDGSTSVSREKAKRQEAWAKLQQAFENEETVVGVIDGKVKGGFTVQLSGIRAFLPGSLVDTRPVRDVSHLEGKDLEFKVIKLDQKRNNVVVSRRAVIEAVTSSERENVLAQLQVGQVVHGVVKNLTEYGAFVDIGGVDGLLHITDMAYKRVKNPGDVVSVGQEIDVKVLKFERDKQRVSLGLKQMGEDPWHDLAARFPQGSEIEGKVTNLTDYGCFVEIADGVEGLVHVSEMDWSSKGVKPSSVVQIGDVVKVKVLKIEEPQRRISLGLKQCRPNPWVEFDKNHKRGDRVTGQIKSIRDFGIFVGLEGGIDGLVHLSDISWQVPGEEAIRNFKEGDEITAVVMQVDSSRERISLGLKQIADDPVNDYLTAHRKGSVVSGTVTAVDQHGVSVMLDADKNVTGFIRVSDLARERVSDPSEVVKVGETVEAKIMGTDRKTRQISLSVRAKNEAEEKEALDNVNRSNKKEAAESLTTMQQAFADAQSSQESGKSDSEQ